MAYKYVLGTLLISVVASRTVPQLSNVFKNEAFNQGASGLVNIWEHALRLQGGATIRDTGSIRAVLSPEAGRMTNLVPQDSAHPLYHDSASNSALRTEFIQDYLFTESIDPNDPQLKSSQGLTRSNLNGNSVTFKKNNQGTITANGVTVSKSSKLSDGTDLYILNGFLFNHDGKVRTAWEELQRDQPPGCGWCK